MSNGEVDKEYLYGNYLSGQREEARYQRQRRRFALKVAHKAADERFDEDDDMQVNANRYSGVGPFSLLGAMGMGAAIFWFANRDQQPPVVQPPPQQPPAVEIPAGTDTFNKIRPLPGE